MNLFAFSGNLGADIEVRYLGSGTAIGTFNVAVKKGFGEHEKTVWVKCQLWGKRAEGGLTQYLVKGAKVLISGELFLDEWEKDGKVRQTLVVGVDKIELAGKKKQSSNHGGPPPSTGEDCPF